MKTFKILSLSAFALTISACSIDVDARGEFKHGYDHISVELDNGSRASFSCPKGTSSFVKRDDNGRLLEYGCKTDAS